MRFYLRSIAELAIEAVVQVRLLVTGRPDVDALAAAGNPTTCPDEIEPQTCGPTELDLTWFSVQSAFVDLEADAWLACMDPADFDAWVGGEWA